MAFKKKLHLYHPARTPVEVEARHTKQRLRREKADPQSLERGVRQLLANKTGGTMAGIWLLIPEYLRLGVWDLLRSWSGASEGEVQSRLALQLVNESALCVSGMRHSRTLGHKGFELANGLPFLATDTAIHCLLDNRSVAEAQRLQVALGKIRQTYGHFRGRLLAIDPHRITSYSKRHMVLRKTHRTDSRATKLAQSFFCLDADTQQPVCFITGTSSRTITQATQQLLSLSADILKIQDDGKPLIMADTEHYTAELFDWVSAHSPFDMLVPMPYSSAVKRAIGQLCGDSFQRHWAGYATARGSYRFRGNNGGPYHQIIQRKGERESEYDYKAFLCTAARDEVPDLSLSYPERWNIEEFFKNEQALGWDRSGTMNLNIQYGRMSMALLAQAACSMMRQRIGEPVAGWDAQHLAKSFFWGMEGDIRVKHNTIIVTYYNAPNLELMKSLYENLPDKLASQGIQSTIPWLYNYKLDFRFK